MPKPTGCSTRSGSPRGSDGLRHLPDGRPLDIVVEDSGESREKGDVTELIRDSWQQIGIRLFTRPMQLTLFRRRVFSGQTLMSIAKGIENGLPTADMPPWEFAPTRSSSSNGRNGASISRPRAWPASRPTCLRRGGCSRFTRPGSARRIPATRAQIWHEMLRIWADEVFSIGLVAGVPQPVVVSTRLRNVPVEGMYNWDPGAHFGMYKPDTFWFDDTPAPAASVEMAPPG